MELSVEKENGVMYNKPMTAIISRRINAGRKDWGDRTSLSGMGV